MKIQRIGPEWWLTCTSNPHPVVPWAFGTGALPIHSGKWCLAPAIVVAE